MWTGLGKDQRAVPWELRGESGSLNPEQRPRHRFGCLGFTWEELLGGMEEEEQDRHREDAKPGRVCGSWSGSCGNPQEPWSLNSTTSELVPPKAPFEKGAAMGC